MQPPSLGEWFIPFVLAGVAVITALWAKERKMSTRVALLAYLGFGLLGLGAYLFRSHEYNEWKKKDCVVIRSHMGHERQVSQQDPSANKIIGNFAFFQIVNESSKRVKVTNFWIEDCALDGKPIFYIGDLPKSLDPADDYLIDIPLERIPCKDWFDKARARLTDGSIIKSMKNENVPAWGNAPTH